MARVLEGASVSLYGQAGAMRAADHQFQQALVVGVMDRLGAPDFLIDAKRATEDFVAEIAAKAKTSLLEPPLGVRMAWQLQRQRAERGD